MEESFLATHPYSFEVGVGIMSHKMAAVRRLFSVDITGTCLKVRGSVGDIYVSIMRDQCS